ncbi:hypothetical protein ACQJBY_042456 [Aegilops geniculata]
MGEEWNDVETEPYHVSKFFQLFDTAHQKQNWMRRDIEGETVDAPIMSSDDTVPEGLMDNQQVTYLNMWSLVEVTNSLVLLLFFSLMFMYFIIQTRRFVGVTGLKCQYLIPNMLVPRTA